MTPARCSRVVLYYAILHNKAVTLGLSNFQDDAVVVEPEINVGPDRVAGHPVAANAVRDRLVADHFNHHYFLSIYIFGIIYIYI